MGYLLKCKIHIFLIGCMLFCQPVFSKGYLNPVLKQASSIRINVKDYGAKGDGTTDDSPAIQRVMSIKSSKNIEVYFPIGNYIAGSTINTVKANTKIIFETGAKIRSTSSNIGIFNFLHDSTSIMNAEMLGNGNSASDLYQGFGILLTGASNCHIVNCRFSGISGTPILMLRSNAKGCSRNRITGNTIVSSALFLKQGYDSSAIMLGYSGLGYTHDSNVIDGNVIDGGKITNHGIAIIGHGKKNIIRNNKIRNCLRYGIVAYESDRLMNSLSGTRVLNNLVENIGAKDGTLNNMGMGIYLMKSHNSIISGNIINNTLLNSDESETLNRGAIAINGGMNCRIENNSINNSKRYGIVVAYSFYTKILNNQINKTANSGVFLINTSCNDVIGNTFRDIPKANVKGFFQNTSGTEYNVSGTLRAFKNRDTGDSIVVKGNKFFGDAYQLLYFEGAGKMGGSGLNQLKNINISNNQIYKNSHPVDKLFILRNGDQRLNRVSGNIINKN